MGIPERQYYCMDERGNISLKLKSLSSSIFHEFTHCLHEIEDRGRYDVDRHSVVPDPWTDREERRTISGYIEADTYTPVNIYDPICDNCYHLCDSIVHGEPYIPRIGHCGYRSDTPTKAEQDQRDKLLQYYKISDFNLAWPERYMIH
jgi:hypothetical protein